MKTNTLKKATLLLTFALGFCTVAQAKGSVGASSKINGYYKLIPSSRFPVKEVAAFSRCNQVEGVMKVYQQHDEQGNLQVIVMKQNYSYLGYPFIEGQFTETEQYTGIPVRSYVSKPRLHVTKEGIEELAGPTKIDAYEESENEVKYSEKLVRGIISLTTRATSAQIYGRQQDRLQLHEYRGFGATDTCQYQKITEQEYTELLARRQK
ncbi:hypothetical protein [Pseudobdellovibrio exovorus]|uniref:Uncharacterized protein n=1 Tax=Pseudobdellovibrio exovorus JSS TaxID=1184267 RepID=M4V564_9BACT|nr:hypothetical protein [Pseudobdellovibrio exovorus]AGH94328.1 hypothetical protein A11Q_108 [Pseudobdellovibrio exovorus JSS]